MVEERSPVTGAVTTPERTAPCQVVVMGVSGTGKTSAGLRLADELDVAFIEGDDHHPRSNVEKMAAGIPLTDEDRLPWLRTLTGLLAARDRRGESAVLACSSLRRSYRDILRSGVPRGRVFFVHLDASLDVLEQRMARRTGHFMPVRLLRSQVETLEPLGPDEPGAVVDVAPPLDEVVERAVAAVRDGCGGGDGTR